jgi:anti-anti-sigma factor
MALEGRLDSASYQVLEEELAPFLDGRAKSIRFDMAGLEYMSSMGLRVFLKVGKTLRTKDGKMVFTNLQPQIRKVFEIAGALPSLNVFETTEEADRYLDEVQRQVLAKQDAKGS